MGDYKSRLEKPKRKFSSRKMNLEELHTVQHRKMTHGKCERGRKGWDRRRTCHTGLIRIPEEKKKERSNGAEIIFKGRWLWVFTKWWKTRILTHRKPDELQAEPMQRNVHAYFTGKLQKNEEILNTYMGIKRLSADILRIVEAQEQGNKMFIELRRKISKNKINYTVWIVL